MAPALSEIVRSPFKSKLKRGEIVTSMTVRLVRSIEIVRIAKTAGFDAIYMDMEHSSLDFDTVGQISVMAIEANLDAFVRVPANTSEYISRVLDGGATGIIAPDVRSAAEAREVVNAAKYPPLGRRGFSGSMPQLQFRSYPARDALAAMNDAITVMVQFESSEAFDKADEILSVDGVDLALIGTNDFLLDVGNPGDYGSEQVRNAYARAIEAADRCGKHVGVGGLSSQPQLVADFVAMGASYVSTGTDLAFLLKAATANAQAAQSLAPRKLTAAEHSA